MEKQLAECLAENRIYTLYEGGITMLRKLFNGRRKFAALGALVVLLGSVGALIWTWAQIAPPRIVPVRVVEIEAEVSSIKLPIQGEWKETGPIKVQVASGATQFPLGYLDIRQQEAVIVWPVSVSAPLLKELGFEKIEVSLVGLGIRKGGSFVSSDLTVLRLPNLPNIIVAQTWSCVTCNIPRDVPSAFWAGQPGGEIRGTFAMDKKIWEEVEKEAGDKYGDPLRIVKKAFSIASQFMYLPVEDIDTFIANVYRLNKQTLHELVVYIPEFGVYQTADLTGMAALRVER